MGRRKKQPNDGFEFYDFLRAVLFSVLAAVLVVTALIALFALVLSFITIPPVVLSGMAIATLMLAGVVSGYLAAKSIRKKAFWLVLSAVLQYPFCCFCLPVFCLSVPVGSLLQKRWL